ncbi:MAG: sigma-70 family RNA polymerase sigma factor, partial [Thermomicrobiales bacterium]
MSKVSGTTTPEIDLGHELTKGFAARFIRSKARRMMGHASLESQDREDVEQELMTAVIAAAPGFDSAAGDWESFVATVVERRAGQMLHALKRAKRLQGNKPDSLDVLVEDADGVQVPLATQIRSEHQSAVTGCYSITDQELTEQRLDLQQIIAALPEEERAVVLKLAEQSQSEVASDRGVARRTLRDLLEQARQRISA